MQINVTYDASVSGAPAGFTAAVDAAVAYYENNFDGSGTINITIGWGTAVGVTIPPGALGATWPAGFYLDYEEVRNALWGDAQTPAALTAAMNLPAQDPTNGGLFFMTSAEGKALGLISPFDSGTDGTIVIDPTTDYAFDPNNRAVAGKVDLIGVLEHEIGHVLGRVSDLATPTPGGGALYGALDLFRYSAPGVLSPSATSASFSIDGQHLLLPFNDPSNGGDADDWSINLTGDAFDAFGDVGVQEQISGTDKTMLDVFGFHPHQGAPVIAVPGGTPLTSTNLADNAHIAQGQTVYFSDVFGYTLQGAAINAGTIINITVGGVTINNRSGLLPAGSQFTNTATGAVIAEATGYDTSYAIEFDSDENLSNSGLIQSVSQGDANGIYLLGRSDFMNTASGVVQVWGKYSATGLIFNDPGSSFTNQGVITVIGDTDLGDPAHGIDPQTGAVGVAGGFGTFINNGTLQVTSILGDAPSIGVEFFQWAPTNAVINTGTIIADYAFYVAEGSTSPAFEPDINIVNSGKIIGAISLANGYNQIHNTGIIGGNIYFGNSDNSYDGVNGHLYGDIYLGHATNTVTLGNDGDTVYGGGGADTITGGSGNDTFMIARGTNHLDGKGGYNTLSLQSAAGGYTVDLGAGTAVGAGTTSIANIQRVIGSSYADTLIAGNNAAFLMGGGGADILRGGAGADTLVAGTGGDTLTGNGGNDTFIYTAGDGQVVITDFRASGNDVLAIYGYGSASSVHQQGSDTLITLSGSDSILLKNVSSIPGGATVYNAGNYVPPPASAPQYIFANHPADTEAQLTNWFFLNYGLKVYSNEHITMDFGPPVNQNNFTPGYYGIVMDGDSNKPNVVTGLDNFGQISAVARGGGLYGITVETNVESGSLFTNEAGASFTITDTNGQAMGIYSQGNSPSLVNAGTFGVTTSGAVHQADGVYTWDSHFSFNNTATGTFAITSNDSWAFGMELNNGGTFRNDGQFSVYGAQVAYGVWEDHFAYNDTVVNNGTITVSSAAGGATTGFFFRGTDDVQLPPVSFINTGTITAKTAIQSINTIPGFSPYQAPSLNIQNSGTINGDINLGGAISRVTSTGTINGNILIHDDYAGFEFNYFPQLGLTYGPGQTIDLRGGHFNGSIEISPGYAGDVVVQDVIYTGTATTTVKIDGGQTNLAATIRADAGGHLTIQYDMASTAASWSDNPDGSLTVSAGDHGTETLFNVEALKFTDRTVSNLAPVAPNISIGNANVTEGGVLHFGVTLDRATSRNVTLSYDTFAGTASMADNDYLGGPGTLTILAGQTTGTINIQTVQDTKVEPDETMSVHLLTANLGTITQGIGTGTIVNDDVAPVSPNISIGNASVTEGGVLHFGVTLSVATSQNIILGYDTFAGTASMADNDYVGGQGTLTILAGQTTGTINIQTVQDTKVEPDETMSVHLLTANLGTITQGIGTGTLVNDDFVPNISIGNASATEGGVLHFGVTLSVATSQNVTLSYDTFAGTASMADNDYLGGQGTLTILAGQTTGTINLQTVQDSKVEPDETMSVHLLTASLGTITQGVGNGTIVNDDVAPVSPNISIGNASVTEGGVLHFGVTLSAATSQNITLGYDTFAGTASMADNDYLGGQGTLTILAGQTTGTINIQTVQDSKIEPDETMSVHLLTASLGTIAQGIGTGTIVNDDVIPNITIGNASATEGGVLHFGVTLDRAASQDVTLGYDTFAGTASMADNDYLGGQGTLTILAGQTTGTINVQTVQDTKVEPDETMSVHLLTASLGTITQGVGTGTIVNDDVAPVSPNISIGNASVTEGGVLHFGVTLNQATTQNVTLSYDTFAGTASMADNDYLGGMGTLTILAGQTTGTINIQTVQDTRVEPDETMSVHLLTASLGNITQGVGTGTIVNDDVVPVSLNITIGNASVTEGGVLHFGVTLSVATSQDVTLGYDTFAGTASMADNDYLGGVGTLTILAGQTTGTINIQTVQDSKVEPDETMSVHLLTASLGNITQGVGTGTILSNSSIPAAPGSSMTPPFGMHLNSLATTLAGMS